MNIRHFLRSIGDTRNFLSFCSLARFTALGSPANFDWAGIHHCLFQIKGFASHNNGHPEFWIFRIKLLLDKLPTLTTLQQHKPNLYSPDWLCPQCNSAPEDINHLWTYEFSALDCWNFDTPSLSCLWLTRGLLPAHLTTFLKEYFLLSVVYKIISPLLNDFQIELYGEIWLCWNVLFHAWEESQGISASSKTNVYGDMGNDAESECPSIDDELFTSTSSSNTKTTPNPVLETPPILEMTPVDQTVLPGRKINKRSVLQMINKSKTN
ncbi:hypothetical protein RhiirA4_478077 [Rhizophagus irregularis]|uniref:Uncharacterized protein n=1 Tax=Rhizophagus irregularis TaxID=588596 RepID=A0A2I1HE77_9GLOM|nr:hypothetical protein RhiirA4_478077 [Rhizophagus irregularis]